MITAAAVRRAVVVGGVLAVAIVAVLLLHVSLGRSGMSVEQAWLALSGQPERRTHALIMGVRIPRALGAIIAGAALAVAGALLQTVMRNPLAEPGMIGVSGGAALGVVSALFVGVTLPGGVIINALVGATIAPLLILAVCRRRWTSPPALALAGTLLGALLSAVTTALLITQGQALSVVLRWLVGSLNPVSWRDLQVVTPVLLLGALITAALIRPLGVLRLSETHAIGLGSQTRRTRAFALIAAIALTVGGVLIAGAVPFIGLVGGHLARRLVGSAPATLIPIAALVGALALLAADLAAMRTTAALPWSTNEVTGLPVGALIAPLSAPYLIWIIRRRTT